MQVQFSKFLSQSDQLKIKPTHGLKRAYSIPELHKWPTGTTDYQFTKLDHKWRCRLFTFTS